MTDTMQTKQEEKVLPEFLSQRFTISTGSPKRTTEIINKRTGKTYAVLKQPKRDAKIGDEIVRRFNCHADLLAALEVLVELGTERPEHQAAERAIAKAKGMQP